MAVHVVYFWKKAPFIRLLLSLMAGIILQWHLQINLQLLWIILSIAIILSAAFFFIPVFKRYTFNSLNGVMICFVFAGIGALLTWQKDIRHDRSWIGNAYKETDALLVTIDEPLVEKTKSIKANATVSFLQRNDSLINTTGKIILYFKKDSSLLRSLQYGSQIIFKKKLQEIKNSGNPGGFDYKRYSLFNGITHQVYLKPEDFQLLPGKKQNVIRKFIYSSREWVLNSLRKNIIGDKELGLAEALLIGYKDDLDQTLVQSYTNTGVVHVIAISGLHLGLIYWLLLLLFKPLQRSREAKWVNALLVITGLWLFTLLAGAQPSVLRSAVMFSCLVLGKNIDKKASIFNTLAFSAFILLCINPYWLWDVGFQLSYTAVLSIVIFMRPIYNLFYTKNKIIDFFWKLNAVTFAAQVLTVPVSIYHFHQFPVYFFITNFIAVPLSSIILIGEIIVCVISFIPTLALFIGKIVSWLIWLMNTCVERVEAIPHSLWDNLQINVTQAFLIIIAVAAASFWLMEKSKQGFITVLAVLLIFFTLRTYSLINTNGQQKLIVYNIPQKQAIDIIDGQDYIFIGDSSLQVDDFARNFHLKPARIRYRLSPAEYITDLSICKNFISYKSKHILLLNKSVFYSTAPTMQTIDLLIISQNPKINIPKLSKAFEIKQVVFDGTLSPWKVNSWKKDCDSLHIPYYDVVTDGAFVMNLR
ncbi:MAG TPA: ComEC/Rec2 family competence protein [Chitinophagaceae bacterium]